MVSLDFTSVSPEKQPNTLSISEQTTLAEHERVIERGLKTFYEVGNALIQIRDNRLYRQNFKTFEDYCQERWALGRNYANKLISASEVVFNLGTIVPKSTTETHIRPLVQLEPEEQRLAWEVVQQTAPQGKVTAAHVKSVVDVLKEVTRTHAIDDGTGIQVSVSDVFKSAIIEETAERMRRQETYISEKQKITHVSHNSGVNEWYTPPEYIDAAKDVLGTIDLDPASSEIANQLVKATTFYTAEDDGLSFEWRGKVWMNPPYASELIGRFAAKFARHVQQGDITTGIVLVNNATETVWFSDLVSVASVVVFTKGRVKFLDPEGNPGAPLQGQALIYFGDNPSWFLEVFSKFGWGATL